MLFNEPKLLKCRHSRVGAARVRGFSALQRAEIAEIDASIWQRAARWGFSALQRAEIAEIFVSESPATAWNVSVLFNEPKLLKLTRKQ